VNVLEYSKFENQYILTLASRAKRELMLEAEEEKEKMKLYNTTESFLDPNINRYIEVLGEIIKKAKVNMQQKEN
jgi:hypothetical protein